VITYDEHLVRLWAEVAELKRRQANVVRHGPVKEVDAKKRICRVQLNPDGDKEQPFKTAWIPYAQFAGDYKFHNPPTVGQNVTVFAPGGELSQAVALPFTWSDQFPSPSEKQDEHIVTFGKTKITIKKDLLEFLCGSASITLTESGKITLKGDLIETDGTTKLDKGSDLVATEAGLAKRVYAKV